MQRKEANLDRPLGVCKRIYNFVMVILSSRILTGDLSQKHSSNNEDSEIKIEFSESLVGKEKGGSRRYETQKGKKMKTRTAKNETHVKFKTDNRHRKETSLQEDEDSVVCRERIPSRVFSNIDERSEAFIRSRLEAMRRSHNIDSRMF